MLGKTICHANPFNPYQSIIHHHPPFLRVLLLPGSTWVFVQLRLNARPIGHDGFVPDPITLGPTKTAPSNKCVDYPMVQIGIRNGYLSIVVNHLIPIHLLVPNSGNGNGIIIDDYGSFPFPAFSTRNNDILMTWTIMNRLEKIGKSCLLEHEVSMVCMSQLVFHGLPLISAVHESCGIIAIPCNSASWAVLFSLVIVALCGTDSWWFDPLLPIIIPSPFDASSWLTFRESLPVSSTYPPVDNSITPLDPW